jgi:hypothetical protein
MVRKTTESRKHVTRCSLIRDNQSQPVVSFFSITFKLFVFLHLLKTLSDLNFHFRSSRYANPPQLLRFQPLDVDSLLPALLLHNHLTSFYATDIRS